MSTAVAVNCFETDAMSNRVSGVSGILFFRSARPAAPAHATVPLIATAAEHPGRAAGTCAASASSLRCDCSASLC